MPPDVKLILGDREEIQTDIMVFHQIMINASPVFEAMLQRGKYVEGIRLKETRILNCRFPMITLRQ
jgi:hypothetical protein